MADLSFVNTREFSRLISKPSTLTVFDMAMLEDLVELYPFSYPLHISYAYALNKFKPEKFDDYISKAATYTPDRTLLYNILNNVNYFEDSDVKDTGLLPTQSLQEVLEDSTKPSDNQNYSNSFSVEDIEPVSDNSIEEVIVGDSPEITVTKAYDEPVITEITDNLVEEYRLEEEYETSTADQVDSEFTESPDLFVNDPQEGVDLSEAEFIQHFEEIDTESEEAQDNITGQSNEDKLENQGSLESQDDHFDSLLEADSVQQFEEENPEIAETTESVSSKSDVEKATDQSFTESRDEEQQDNLSEAEFIPQFEETNLEIEQAEENIADVSDEKQSEESHESPGIQLEESISVDDKIILDSTENQDLTQDESSEIQVSPVEVTDEEDTAPQSELIPSETAEPEAIFEEVNVNQQQSQADEEVTKPEDLVEQDTDNRQQIESEERTTSHFSFHADSFENTIETVIPFSEHLLLESLIDDDQQQIQSPDSKGDETTSPVQNEIIGNIASVDYFVFDKSVIDPLQSDEETEQTTYIEPEESITEPVKEEAIARYDDDKMPFSFLWWLNKTRKEHADGYQPYASKSSIKEEPVKQHQTQLNQQIIENIFHIQPTISVLENQTHHPISFGIKRREDVLIEKFISEDPQIRPPKGDKLDTENKARKSSEDNLDLVSETLAKIYTDQMLYHKAIDTYQKLSFKFPEKSAYFAGQIRELEKKFN